MSALVRSDWNSGRIGFAAETTFPAPVEENAMRENLNVVRDTMIVFGLQIVFRAMLFLRRINF